VKKCISKAKEEADSTHLAHISKAKEEAVSTHLAHIFQSILCQIRLGAAHKTGR